ncbi:MAG TPA: LacI family DNA-binding transcriptional regulator [Dongiaceae bacterium]|jgi:DNA-binding LacI/PurR family transcriptional regulator|nr:LacI family DNA-binding transcriptional regulator [Dongiaceae bacterium]
MVTQEQIAKKLGVSRQLVTFALAGYPQVSAASRKRILAAAAQLGYQPNPHARALKNASTGIIALWIPDQISTHYSHVARELNRLVKKLKHELIITEVANRAAEEVLSHVPVDGVMAVDAPRAVTAYLSAARARKVPVVYIGADRFARTDCVQVDLLTGANQVMTHLLASGFRRIVHATFMTKDHPAATRRRGYLQAMEAAGLPPEFLYYPLSEEQRPLVRQLVQDYIRKHGCPEAIFCHSDDVAVGIYRGLRDLHLRVPQDVALVGCDGIPDVEYLECPITTLVQPVAEMCATAWQFLQRRLEAPTIARQITVLKPTLVARESSRRGQP